MRATLTFICLFLISFGSFAQEYSYRYYSISDGLPQTQITTLFQDSKGFIWIGTKGGLSRFDGVEFENFDIEDGLTSRIVCNISEGRDGKIYVLCDHGLSVFDGNKFNPYPFPKDIRAYMVIASVVHDHDYNIWIASKWQDKWIFFKFKNGVYSGARSEFAMSDTVRVESLIYDETDSSIWAGSVSNGLYHLKKNNVSNYLNHLYEIHLKKQYKDTFIFTARYILSENYFLFKYSPNTSQISEILDSIGRTVICTGPNHFFASIYGKSNGFREYQNGSVFKLNKTYRRTTCGLEDIEGNFWIGTESGLFRLKTNAFLNFTEKSGINEYVWSIVEDKKGEIWFASFIDGISVYNGKTFSYFNRKSFPPTFGTFYRGAIRNKNGNILFTDNRGILKYDGRSFIPVDSIPKVATLFLFDDTIKNKLLISSSIYGLLIKEKNKKLANYNISPGPIKEYISTINMDNLGRYWLGGFYGITILDGDSLIKLPTKELPYDKGAISSFRDSLGNLWFGTTSGLYLYDYTSFRKIGESKIKSYVMSLAGMAQNKLFIGMVKGMGMLDLEKFYSSNKEDIMLFDYSNGFLGEECKQNGVFTDSKGFTWVATSDRVIRIDPRKICRNTFKPKIYLKSVRVISEKKDSSIVLSPENLSKLRWFQKDIRFDYHAISHTAPEGVRYKFRLTGYDKDWSEATPERYATYTNLKHGDYEFQVKACNSDQVWCEQVASFRFSIIPAFWQTRFFLFGSNFLFLIFIISGILYYLRKKRLKKEEKEQLDKKFTELQLKTIKNQMDPHFTFNAMNSLGALIFTEKKETAYDYLVNFSRLVRATLESSNRISRTLEKELDFTRNYLELQQFRFKNKMEYTIQTENGVNIKQKVPRMVIQTHVENALKHGLMNSTKKGLINIVIRTKENILIIEISDNGIGRKKAKEINKDSTKKGLVVTEQFFDLINKFNKVKIRQEIIDLCDGNGKSAGTKVVIYIPESVNYDF
jgi:ligand-binding sensor domain-containing protein